MSVRFLDNRTPMVAGVELFDDRHGRRVLTIIAKMTWFADLNGDVWPAAHPEQLRLVDEPLESASARSLRFPTDYAPEKPGTDVVLVGTAHPPRDHTVTNMQVSLRIETGRRAIHKRLLVYGPRIFYESFRGIVPGPPGALRPTPLCYELTYGGVDRSDPERPLVEPRNPIGMGIARDRRALAGTPTPQIEDPEHPLTSHAPAPAGFGPIPAHWAPRAGFSGTRDEAWRRTRAPIVPLDFDPRFHCFAPPGLWSEEPLSGDEPIEALGVTLAGAWRFRLPRCRPLFFCKVRGAPEGEPLPTHLDTFLLDADARRVEATYRASVPAPRKLDAIERIRIVDEGDPESSRRRLPWAPLLGRT